MNRACSRTHASSSIAAISASHPTKQLAGSYEFGQLFPSDGLHFTSYTHLQANGTM